MNDRHGCIALNMISGIGHAKYSALCNAFESPGKVFSQSLERLTEVKGIGPLLAEKIIRFSETADLEPELEFAERGGVRILTLLDLDYPEELRELFDPPLCIYVRGTLPKFGRNAIGIVGSRRMSGYGERITRSFASGAVMSGFVVVSGLAYGVDYVAHKTVADANGCTVAVLGGGLARIHPQEHVPLARQIIDEGGAVISEFPMNFPVSRTSFPRRNRIVAALSHAVIVTEAGLDSGALITALAALNQGKYLFAVPGNADNPQAKGCHKLIREGNAALVEDFSQVLESLEGGLFSHREFAEPGGSYDPERCDDLSEEERLLASLLEHGAKSFDALSLESDLESGRLVGLLMSLEMKMVILKNPDKTYQIR